MGMKPLTLTEVMDIVEKEPGTLFDFESNFIKTFNKTFGDTIIEISNCKANERMKNIYLGKWFLSK